MTATDRKVVVLDRTDQDPVQRPAAKKPSSDRHGLTEDTRRMFNAKKRQRVKVQAHDAGYRMFRDADPSLQKRVRDVEAIMRDASSGQGDARALRLLYRAMVDGIIEAVRTIPEAPVTPAKGKVAK